jgi:hypothetical protein
MDEKTPDFDPSLYGYTLIDFDEVHRREVLECLDWARNIFGRDSQQEISAKLGKEDTDVGIARQSMKSLKGDLLDPDNLIATFSTIPWKIHKEMTRDGCLRLRALDEANEASYFLKFSTTVGTREFNLLAYVGEDVYKVDIALSVGGNPANSSYKVLCNERVEGTLGVKNIQLLIPK